MARDEELPFWLLVRWRATRGLRTAVATFRVATPVAIGSGATIAVHARTPVAIGTRATIAAGSGLAVSGLWAAVAFTGGLADLIALAAFRAALAPNHRLPIGGFGAAIPFALNIGAAGLALRHAATGLIEVLTRRAANILPTLHRSLLAGARSHVGDHASQLLDGLLGQLLAHLRKGASAGDGGVGFKFGGLHNLVADEALVGLVSHRRLADLTAETHGLLSVFAHGPLVGLEETPQRGTLVIVQIAEEFLRVELSLGLAALAFGGADLAALAVCRAGFTTFATRGVVAAGLGGANFATRVFTGAELTARRALAFDGAFFTGTVLGGASRWQCHEGYSTERREQRVGDGGQFHIFFR